MSSAILKYTSKLNTNLQNIKKRIGEISKKSGEEKNRAILDLYMYFKRDTNVRVNLFTSAEETITRCLTVTECIHRDLEYLKRRCDTDLVSDERQEYCNGLVKQISHELLSILDMVEQKAESILNEPDILDLFIEHLKEEKSEELNYLSRLLGKTVTRNNIDSYQSEIKNKLSECYKGKRDRDNRIKWIVHGYIFGKNRRLEDWFPSVNSRFIEYDELLDRGIVDTTTIRFSQYNKKNLNGGLIQLEDTLKKYRVDTKNYKVYNKATNETIDFSEYRDDLHPDVSYVYRDPNTDEKLLTVIAPRSVYSAVYWGWDTKWCTARIDKSEDNIFENNMFGNYYKDNDLERLYIIQYKTNKYQLHFKSSQFMNVEDEAAELNDTENKLFGKWIEHFVSERPNSGYSILKFCIDFGISYPLDLEVVYRNSTQIQIDYKKTGSYMEWWPNGEINLKASTVNGKLHGGYKKWYRSGQIDIETTYVDGKRHGSYKKWYPNRKIQIETTYVNGKRHGDYKELHSNGQIEIETTYVNGKIHGGYKRWYDHGQIFVETTYVDDEQHGGYKQWYPNGQIEIETTYVDGKRHGGYKQWYADGKIEIETTYVDGKQQY